MCGRVRTGAVGRFGVGRGGAHDLSWTATLLCAGGASVGELVPLRRSGDACGLNRFEGDPPSSRSPFVAARRRGVTVLQLN